MSEEKTKIRNIIKEALKESFDENYLKSDSVGYNVGEYIYHVTPIKNLSVIKRNGLHPQNGISINGKKYENRLYFATSLIAAYDISVNFGSYKNDKEYVIFKIKSDCLTNGYEKDPLFVHGIFIDYSIPNKCIVDIIEANKLFRKYDDNDLDNLYLNESKQISNVFGHKLEVLLDMIGDQIDNPKRFLNYKIKKLNQIQKQSTITLYRVVYIKNPNMLNKNNFGHHYVLSTEDFHEEMLDYLYQNSRKLDRNLDEDDMYLIEIETPASNIDYYETMRTFALHPFEDEITIKDDNQVKFKNIEKFYG